MERRPILTDLQGTPSATAHVHGSGLKRDGQLDGAREIIGWPKPGGTTFSLPAA
jgi:hypothetical protein